MAAIAGTWFSGCAAPAPPFLGERPAGLPDRVEHEDTPFHPQLDFQCGPAALATALGHVGIDASPQRLVDQVFLPSRQGSLQIEMLAGARRQGAVSTRIDPTIEALLREVAAGHVVVVLQNLALSFAPRWHYAVVIGYDLARLEVVLRSGTTRREVMSLRTFGHTWARSGNWGYVALLPGAWPVSARREDAIEAALGFERVAPAAQAATVYQSALARWPDDFTLAIGWGNSLARDGRLDEAAQVLRAAGERHAQAPAWINLSSVLLKRGDATAALEAAQEGLRVATPTWEAASRRAVDAARQAAEAAGAR